MRHDTLREATILIVDDELANVRVLEQLLEHWGCRDVHSTTNPALAASLFQRLHPDIVLLDLMMPEMDGFEVMKQLRPLVAANDYLPILVLTADPTSAARHRALSLGARDFLTKPFDQAELSLRCKNLLEARLLHRQLQNQNAILEERVRERTEELERSEIETLECLAAAAEYRDDDTGQHTQRVGEGAALLAHGLGLPDARVELIRRAAPLHDVGKIGISDLILLKPGKLTPEEFRTMQQHCLIGAGILSRHHTPLLQLAATIALSHHERWDGSGYPYGIQGENIPLEGRIVAVVDVFDALTHERPYKRAWSIDEAMAEIRTQVGLQFDPAVTTAFLELAHHFPQ